MPFQYAGYQVPQGPFAYMHSAQGIVQVGQQPRFSQHSYFQPSAGTAAYGAVIDARQLAAEEAASKAAEAEEAARKAGDEPIPEPIVLPGSNITLRPKRSTLAIRALIAGLDGRSPRQTYRCRKCGEIKRGHDCPYKDEVGDDDNNIGPVPE